MWQVLGVYLLGGWVALRGVQAATDRIGLPEWTPTMALLLMGLLLPVTIATAVVQGGLPWLRIVDYADPNELEGLTPEQVHVVPQAHPLHGAGILTWTNAVLLGVMFLALLVTSVVAYLTMWALGIGPVGSLLAQGAISDQDFVLVSDFENRTDEVALGRSLRRAFEADLAESALVNVVDEPSVSGALTRMGQNPQQTLTPHLAGQVAGAEGVAAVIEGEVSRLGGGYRISVGIVLPPGTSPVLSQSAISSQ